MARDACARLFAHSRVSQTRRRVVRVAADRERTSERTPHVDALMPALEAAATGATLRGLYKFNIES
jgi:hypothetical protein